LYLSTDQVPVPVTSTTRLVQIQWTRYCLWSVVRSGLVNEGLDT